MTDKPLTRDQLEERADAATLAAEELEKQLAAKREEFQAALLAGADIDALSFQKGQAADTLTLIQARLSAARAQLALQEHDASVADTTKRAQLAALDAAELAAKQAERNLQDARAAYGLATQAAAGYAHRQKTLKDEIQRLQGLLLSAVDGRVSTLKPPPKVYSEAPRRVEDVKATPLTS